jgi:hypothetical protein
LLTADITVQIQPVNRLRRCFLTRLNWTLEGEHFVDAAILPDVLCFCLQDSFEPLWRDAIRNRRLNERFYLILYRLSI